MKAEGLNNKEIKTPLQKDKKENNKDKKEKSDKKSEFSKKEITNKKIDDFFKNKGNNNVERDTNTSLKNEDKKAKTSNGKSKKLDKEISNHLEDKNNKTCNQLTNEIVDSDHINSEKKDYSLLNEKQTISDLKDQENGDINNLKKKRPRKSKKETNNNTDNRDHCNICKKEGILVCCDKCPRSFHLKCLKLKKNELPSGNWYCSTCKPIVEKRSKIEKEKQERKKLREEQRINGKKKKKLNYKKLKKERLQNEKKLISEISEKLLNFLDDQPSNFERSAAKSGVTDSGSKNEEISDNYENIPGLKQIADYMKMTDYEKTKEFIKYLVNLVCPKKEIQDQKKKKKKSDSREKRSLQSTNDTLSSLNNDRGINLILACIKDNFPICITYFKDNIQIQQVPVEVKLESPTKQEPKYPIQDKLLYENHDLHEVPKQCLEKTKPKESFIPSNIFGKIIKIWDFIMTFKDILKISSFSPEELYFSLNYFAEEEINLINEIHVSLLYIFGDELSEIDLFSLQDDIELLFIKVAVDNSSKKHVFKHSWLEIIRILINSKRFNLLVTKDIEDIGKRIKYINHHTYNLLSIEEKVIILEFLINSAYETSIIRDEIKEEICRKNDLKKEKSGLEFELKTQELRKREIERSEKFIEAKAKIEILNKKIVEIEETNTYSRIEINRRKKELDIERERYKSILKEMDEIEATRIKIKNRVDKLKEEITSLSMTKKKLIGVDYLKNEYYYFKDYNTKLLVKIKNEWFGYSTEEEMEDLLSRLSEKGINENNLIININKILKKKLKVTKKGSIIEDISEPSQVFLKKAIDWKNQCVGINKIEHKISKNLNSFQKIADLIISLEEKISEYLIQLEKEWESVSNREDFKAYLRINEDVNEFSNAILLLLERFISPYKAYDFNNLANINDMEFDMNMNRNFIFNEDHKIDPYAVDVKRVICQKTKFWSKDHEVLDFENTYYEYLTNKIHSIPALYFAIHIFESLLNNFFKRRDFINKKINNLTKEIEVNNNISTYIEPKSKRIIDDIDENIEENEYFYKKDNQDFSNNVVNNNNFSNYYYDEPITSRRLRNRSSLSLNGMTCSENSKKKKNIEWNETCYICSEFGQLICCEECPNVVHQSCALLNKMPEKWVCEDCLMKLANRRLTRSQKNEIN